MYTCIHACIHPHTQTHMHTYVHTHTHACTHRDAHTHTHEHAHVYRTHTHKWLFMYAIFPVLVSLKHGRGRTGVERYLGGGRGGGRGWTLSIGQVFTVLPLSLTEYLAVCLDKGVCVCVLLLKKEYQTVAAVGTVGFLSFYFWGVLYLTVYFCFIWCTSVCVTIIVWSTTVSQSTCTNPYIVIHASIWSFDTGIYICWAMSLFVHVCDLVCVCVCVCAK